MKNLFKLSSLLFVGLVFTQISCSDDPPPAEVEPLIGKWAMSGAIFNTTTEDPNDVMMIENFGIQGNTLQVPAGNSILEIVVGAMADNVCEEVASYGTFFLELKADGTLFLNCPDEGVSENTGTWVKAEDPSGAGTIITLNVVTDAGTLPITFTNFAMLTDGSKFTGVVVNYPMVKDFAEGLSLTNLQFLNCNMEFTRLP